MVIKQKSLIVLWDSHNPILSNAVMKQLANSEAILGKLDQYGQRYTVDMMIRGLNGNSAMVRTGWIIKPGESIPNLVTIFIK